MFSSINNKSHEEAVELQDRPPAFGQHNDDSRRSAFHFNLSKYPISYSEKMHQDTQLSAFTQRFFHIFQQVRRRLRLIPGQSSVKVLSRAIPIDPTRSTLLVDDRTKRSLL